MAKKKRGVKKAPVASNLKNAIAETHAKEIVITEVPVQERQKKAKPIAALSGTTMITRRHKKFGKFHCLVEESGQAVSNETNTSEGNDEISVPAKSRINRKKEIKEIAKPEQTDNETVENKSDCVQVQSQIFDETVETTIEASVEQTESADEYSEEKNATSIEDEKEETIIPNVEEMEVQSVEEILEKMNTSDTENSETNETILQGGYVEIVEYQSNETSPTEEFEETEISRRFSNLGVNVVKIGENEEILIDSTQDADSSENVFHVDTFDDDVNIVECIAEEIIEPSEENDTNEIEESNTPIIDNATLLSNNVSTESNIECVTKPTENSEHLENESESKQASFDAPEDIPQEEPASSKSKTAKKSKSKNSQPKKTKTKQGKKKNSTSAQSSDSNGSSTTSENSVRRSNRIKSINVLKKRSKGHGLVKNATNKAQDSDTSENSNSGPVESEKPVSSDFANFVMPSSNISLDQKPVKVKSRWRRSSELEMSTLSPSMANRSSPNTIQAIQENVNTAQESIQNEIDDSNEVETRLKQFVHLKENHYLTERFTCKEAKKMICDCFLTPEEMERGEYACGEDCLNRLLMIECGGLCPVGDRCTNKRFQKSQFAPCEVFRTEKKGLGIRAKANIPYGEFILEYVGEVLDPHEFENRASEYSKDNNRHYYFMSLRADAIIDATLKGNISRFINHSCDPNAETQKWTVNGELRIGFFSKRTILAGEEITFDYQFQRYGKEAQKCFCESSLCRGWLGEEPDDDEDDDEDDEEYEELEDDKDETVQIKSEEQDKVEGDVLTEEDTKEKTEIPKKVPIKKKRNKIAKPKTRKEIFDDFDLDREIDSLFTTGLKNQAQTLKLSRLMVRAKEPTQRSKLLKLLRNGEFPCRRLFLDYHGLRLIHGWMTDAQHMCATDKKLESLRLEILQTLATLPIPNKTMLQDSKVLPTVEKWSAPVKENVVDSDSNSPKPEVFKEQEDTYKEKTDTKELVDTNINTDINEKVNEDVKVDVQNSLVKEENVEVKLEITEIAPPAEEVEKMSIEETIFGKDPCEKPPESQPEIKNEETEIEQDKKECEETSNLQREDMDISPVNVQEKETEISKPLPAVEVKEEINYEEEITALAIKLLEEWSVLKEVFRIPKKERIEQMKEHEREADRKYKAGLGLDLEHMGIKKNENRYRILQRYRAIEKIDNSERSRKHSKVDERNITALPKISKHERRKLFAMQVEHAEEERRRKQREMWRQHEQHCFVMGTDPRFTAPYDASQGYHCIWNPQTGQWQNYPLPQPYPNVPPQPYNYGNNVTNMSPNLVHFPNHQMQMPPMSNPMNPNCNVGPVPGQILNTSSKTHMSYQETAKTVDPTQVKFMGPIPPPVKLPPKWKCAKDKYGRPYYYHIKIRKSQWEPPIFAAPEEESESSSSSDTSSLSSDTSTDDSDSDDDMDDARLLQEIRSKFKQMEEVAVPAPEKKVASKRKMNINDFVKEAENESNEEEDENETVEKPSIDMRLKDLLKKDEKGEPLIKKRRSGLVEEIIISPRTEEDRLQYKEDVKRYKENKAKLKRQKEIIMQQTKKQLKAKTLAQKKHKATIKTKLKEITIDKNSEAAKKIKETFRSNMAGVMVGILNAYRKPDCKEGRITNTEDFKHLARKLTHFVMLKELKHCANIEDLTCTDSVKSKAKEFVRKYMSKFGEVYQKPKDDVDYY